jgi:molybdopterin molybdotransferase
MAQLSDDCFAFGGAMLRVAEAASRIAERFGCVAPAETVPLTAACGHILAADIAAPIDLPPWRNAAVDGYAVHHADLAAGQPTTLPVCGRLAAGAAPGESLPRGRALRVFTGAALPDGPDTIFMQEDCTATDAGVTLPPGIGRGANLRPAGEDVARGALALAAGRRLAPPDIGLLAALGVATVPVRAPLRVALFSTGDEITDLPAPAPGSAAPPLAPGRIYDANRFMLAALLQRLGATVQDGGILRDDVDATEAALRRAAASADLVITSGGVSAGEEDHVRTAIARAGEIAFWRVAMKPGRPVALGAIGPTPLLGLPGNPVAALVTFTALGRALLDRLAGAAPTTPLRLPVASGFAHRKKAGRREYLRVTIDAAGRAQRFPKDGAGILTSLTASDALAELAEEITALAPGDMVWCTPLGLLHG